MFIQFPGGGGKGGQASVIRSRAGQVDPLGKTLETLTSSSEAVSSR
jgi:hypothetical protein